MTVGRESREYVDGECVVFDDSFLHEVEHNGQHLRLTLMLDLWHPEMTPLEIRVFGDVLSDAMQLLDRARLFPHLNVYESEYESRKQTASVISSFL